MRKIRSRSWKHWILVFAGIFGGTFPALRPAWGQDSEHRSHRWLVSSVNSPRVLVVERSPDRRVTFRECMRNDTTRCVVHGRPSGYTDRELENRLRSLNTMFTLKMISYAAVAVLSTAIGYRVFTGPLPTAAEGMETYRQVLGSRGAGVGALAGGFVIATAEHLLPSYRSESSALQKAWQNTQSRVDNLGSLVSDLNYALAGIDDYLGEG